MKNGVCTTSAVGHEPDKINIDKNGQTLHKKYYCLQLIYLANHTLVRNGQTLHIVISPRTISLSQL